MSKLEMMNEIRTRPRLSSQLHEICKLLHHQVLLCKFTEINWDRINLLLSADIAECLSGLNLIPYETLNP